MDALYMTISGIMDTFIQQHKKYEKLPKSITLTPSHTTTPEMLAMALEYCKLAYPEMKVNIRPCHPDLAASIANLTPEMKKFCESINGDKKPRKYSS